MVSNAKRMKYVSENDEMSSSEEENSADEEYLHPTRKVSHKKLPGKSKNTFSGKFQNALSQSKSKQGKWLSKNAIMARENRLKKKLYMTNLETEVNKLKTENNKYSKVVENQSLLITDLRKQVRYLKSVIANSSDISKLIRNIHQSTGMSVSTSLDETLSLNNAYLSKHKQPPIARKTAHPWDEPRYPSYPTPEPDFLSSSSPEHFDSDLLFNDIKLDSLLDVGSDLIDICQEVSDLPPKNHLTEHNYTSVLEEERDEDVGVCLHVSKHRVSLEFCSTCSENASSHLDGLS